MTHHEDQSLQNKLRNALKLTKGDIISTKNSGDITFDRLQATARQLFQDFKE